MGKRVDIHSPSKIEPSKYRYVMGYAFARDGAPPFNLDAARRLQEGRTVFGSNGRCGVCGACFIYGQIYEHENGDLVHMGEDCAEKYEILAAWPQAQLDRDRLVKNRAASLARIKNAKRREVFLAKHQGLADALEGDHRILADMKGRFMTWCELSEKQIALAFKLAAELKAPPASKPVEINVPAPVSDARVTVEGVIVSIREHEGQWGFETKITVKVVTPAGVWLAWGTAPRDLCAYRNDGLALERGDRIRFDARLQAGKEAHFAFFKRPTNAKVLDRAPRGEP